MPDITGRSLDFISFSPDQHLSAFTSAHTLVPEVLLDFSLRKRSRASREAATMSYQSDEEREKNLWLTWPRISLSYRQQGQDLTLGR